ncbi:speckle-type POZ protein-like [Belonocnema kinseyi]|uniref:speckle-type POZ protein-like n=1 Tax=Belonocnema kinseyi TaxID=2817044 RepID=UPI00143D0190|nr:speckle-type POZ protein-like [Belonocnema kinseyi]
MSKENSADVESVDVIKDYCSSKMKFKTYSLKWTINNYDFVSKTVKLLKSSEFPFKGKETEKWYIEFKPPEISETNENKFCIRVKKKENGQSYVCGSISFIGSSGKIYCPDDYKGLCNSFYWKTITGKLLNKNLLWNETPGKTLIILCEILVLDTTENYLYQEISIKPFTSEDFSQEMSKFYLNDQTFQDVTIFVQEKEFKAHKVILAARSQFFAAMFLHEMSETIKVCKATLDL